MSLATERSLSLRKEARRVWKTPPSRARWIWLAACALLYGVLVVWYLYAIKTQSFPGPFNDPLRLFGIIAFLLVLSTAAYSLRRRFARGLPGKMQNWLWMHTWVGISALLIVLLHENFARLTHDFCQSLSCFSNAYWGTSALFALLFLVVSGIVGRLLDTWQAHIIADEASANGVGIVRALEERLLELEYTVERLCAGKSEPFKQYCIEAIDNSMPAQFPNLAGNERGDFQRAYDTLTTHARLVASLQQQQRAQQMMRTWRSVHMILACLALLVILYHGVMELLTNVLHMVSSA